MNALAEQVERAAVPPGTVALWWLAQAGFLFKDSAGTVIVLDPYLSDVVERVVGFRRLSLSPINPEDLRADWVLSSHEHLDHLDTDALPVIARNCPACRFAGSADCLPLYSEMGIPPERVTLLEPVCRYDLGGAGVETVLADHGDLSPGALSLLLDFGAVRVLFTGDTALNLPRMRPIIDRRPDVLLTCINGRFGNLDARQAASLTREAAPRVVVPCHFWMFKEHNGDPQAFLEACGETCPDIPAFILKPGEGLLCTADSIDFIQARI